MQDPRPKQASGGADSPDPKPAPDAKESPAARRGSEPAAESPPAMDPQFAAALVARHGGLGRGSYLLVAVVLAVGFERVHRMIEPGDLLLGLAWLLGLVAVNFVLTLCRVINLASSPWLTGIALLPVAHLAASIHAPEMMALVIGLATWFLWLLLFVLCVALPPGFGRHRRLDWPGRAVLLLATLGALAVSLWALDLLLLPD